MGAPSADIAREQAAQLLGWTAETLWLCPGENVERVQTDAVSTVASVED